MLLKQPKLRQALPTPGACEPHTGNITACSSTWTQTLSSAPGPRHRAGNQLEILLIEMTNFGNEFGLLSGSPSFLSPAGMLVRVFFPLQDKDSDRDRCWLPAAIGLGARDLRF